MIEEVPPSAQPSGQPAAVKDLLVELGDAVRDDFTRKTKKLARQRKLWDKEMAAWRARHPDLAEEWDRYWSHTLPEGFEQQLLEAAKSDKALATRALSGQVIQKLASIAPFLIGGSADLTGSNNSKAKGQKVVTAEDFSGSYIHYGIREHGMAAAMNGLAVHGGVIPYGGTFLVFTDYARPAIRLSALQRARVIYVMTHDSIGLGEDGPTHQPLIGEGPIHVRGVQKVDAQVQRPVNGRDRLLVVLAGIELRHSHAPQTEGRHGESLPA